MHTIKLRGLALQAYAIPHSLHKQESGGFTRCMAYPCWQLLGL